MNPINWNVKSKSEITQIFFIQNNSTRPIQLSSLFKIEIVPQFHMTITLLIKMSIIYKHIYIQY